VTGRVPNAVERAHGTPFIDGSRWLTRQLSQGLMRVRVEGAENLPTGGVLLAANHGSYLDGPLLFGVMPRSATFFVKAEVFRGAVGWYLRKIGQIPVRRGTPEREPLLTALAVLAEGGIVGIFPEGTRRAGSPSQPAETGDVREVRHGIAYLALRSGCPVLPVACLGTDQVLPRGRTVPALRRPVTVVLGEPTPVADPGERPTRPAITAAATRVRDLLADHLRATASSTPHRGPSTGGTPTSGTGRYSTDGPTTKD
jgi:1-acyl-sn-glycerol-3-phosphate acyltransferase